jgi:hypothetical protein
VDLSERTKYKARIAKHIFSDVLQDVDGYWKYFPTPRGGYTEADLEMIALLLREANRKWDDEITEYFSKNR